MEVQKMMIKSTRHSDWTPDDLGKMLLRFKLLNSLIYTKSREFLDPALIEEHRRLRVAIAKTIK